jgi:uncharacterized repeat protein (TIGR01451 family)
MKKRMTMVLALAMTIAVLVAGPAQACACSSPPLAMAPKPDRVGLGEPVTFTVGKTNILPSEGDWSVRDHLPAGLEFVSATSSQGTCDFLEDSNIVQCDLGALPAGGWAIMDITVVPTVAGEITNYAADNGENQASATVIVE